MSTLRLAPNTAPGTPTAGKIEVYVDTDKKLKTIDDTGLVRTPIVSGDLGFDVGRVARIYDSTLPSPTANFDVTSIPATFSHLILLATLRCDGTGTGLSVFMNFNGDTGANYSLQQTYSNGSSALAAQAEAQSALLAMTCAAVSAPSGSASSETMFIQNYAGTTFHKSMTCLDYNRRATGSTGQYMEINGGTWASTAAINRITIKPDLSSNFVTGCRFSVYGVL